MCLVLFLICDNILEEKLLLKWTCLELRSLIRLQRATYLVSGVCVCVVEGWEGDDELTRGCPFT